MLVVVFGAAAVGGAFALGYGLGRIDGGSSARRELSQKSVLKPTKKSGLMNAMRIRRAP